MTVISMEKETMNNGIKLRHNPMRLTTVESFVSVRGNYRDGAGDVYFARSLGADTEFEKRILAIERSFSEQSSQKKTVYLRVDGLPALTTPEDIAVYTRCYGVWKAAGQAEDRSEEESSSCANGRFYFACSRVSEIFRKITPGVSESMEKSFVVKLFFWFDRLIPEELRTEGGYSRKILFCDLVKKQEYLFAYLLTLIGIDVLLLQMKEDIAEELDALSLSQRFTTGEFRRVCLGEAADRSPFSEKVDRKNPPQRILEDRKAQERGRSPLILRAEDIRRPERDRLFQQGILSREKEKRRGSSGVPIPGTLQQKRELDYEELAKLASSIVMIARCDRQGEVLGSGSGIMIGREGYILTNCHVMMREAACFEVMIEEDEKRYPVEELIKYNQATDLAILRIDRKLSPIRVYPGERPLVRGQKVVAIGSPLGLFNSVSEGIISGFRKLDEIEMIQFTAPISAGSSGGALLNLFGELIGVSSGGFMDGQNINLAVGYQYIEQFIRGFV